MRPSTALLALAATPISAFSLDLAPRAGYCPAVWERVAPVLQKVFFNCGRDARQAIRLVFHDCMNSCDGSVVLSDECTTRSENAGLAPYCSKVLGWLKEFPGTGAADMIQFAAAMAMSQCILGPKVQALVGRKDNKNAAPAGGIPSSRDPVEKILKAFREKGFSPEELVALLGTHSVARQFFDDPKKAGFALDNTPERFDIRYYSDTKFQTAPYSLKSDLLLSNGTETWRTWAVYTKSTALWSEKFVPTWNRFAVIGSDPNTLQDCSYLIPDSKVRREEQEANEGFGEKLQKKFIS